MSIDAGVLARYVERGKLAQAEEQRTGRRCFAGRGPRRQAADCWLNLLLPGSGRPLSGPVETQTAICEECGQEYIYTRVKRNRPRHYCPACAIKRGVAGRRAAKKQGSRGAGEQGGRGVGGQRSK